MFIEYVKIIIKKKIVVVGKHYMIKTCVFNVVFSVYGREYKIEKIKTCGIVTNQVFNQFYFYIS